MPRKLRRTASKVLEVIETRWPTSASEIGKILEPKSKRKRGTIFAKYKHHIRRLSAAGLIHSKPLGKVVVVWPKSVDNIKEKLEKLKTIRQIIDSL